MLAENASLASFSIPKHIGIIMDGNGRWATARGLSRSAGHKAGAEAVRNVVKECRRLGVEVLTLYSFSKENWSRPKEEVNFLFRLLADFLKAELSALQQNDIRLNIFGDMAELPLFTRKSLDLVLALTKNNKSMNLNLALNYSGRGEIILACKRFMLSGGKAGELTEEALSGYLYSVGQPEPDLIIRTSGEMRISNFLLFQSAYSEYYFTDTLWPDFAEADLHAALDSFSHRARRFGQT